MFDRLGENRDGHSSTSAGETTLGEPATAASRQMPGDSSQATVVG